MNRADLWMNTCNVTASQNWLYTPTDKSLRSLGKCTEIAGNTRKSGARVQLNTCNAQSAQTWERRETDKPFAPPPHQTFVSSRRQARERSVVGCRSGFQAKRPRRVPPTRPLPYQSRLPVLCNSTTNLRRRNGRCGRPCCGHESSTPAAFCCGAKPTVCGHSWDACQPGWASRRENPPARP